MHIDEIKRRTNPFHPYNIMVIGLGLMVLAWCWRSTEMSLGGLLDGWGNMVTYIAGNPDLEDSGFSRPTSAAAICRNTFSPCWRRCRWPCSP